MAKKKIEKLKDVDLYSLSMFTLYQLTDVPEYSLIGELPYILDKKNLLDFCHYFGGRTIKVPTVNEILSIMYLVLLYTYVNVDGIPFDDAIERVGYKPNLIKNVKSAYNKISKVLDLYEFGRKS